MYIPFYGIRGQLAFDRRFLPKLELLFLAVWVFGGEVRSSILVTADGFRGQTFVDVVHGRARHDFAIHRPYTHPHTLYQHGKLHWCANTEFKDHSLLATQLSAHSEIAHALVEVAVPNRKGIVDLNAISPHRDGISKPSTDSILEQEPGPSQGIIHQPLPVIDLPEADSRENTPLVGATRALSASLDVSQYCHTNNSIARRKTRRGWQRYLQHDNGSTMDFFALDYEMFDAEWKSTSCRPLEAHEQTFRTFRLIGQGRWEEIDDPEARYLSTLMRGCQSPSDDSDHEMDDVQLMKVTIQRAGASSDRTIVKNIEESRKHLDALCLVVRDGSRPFTMQEDITNLTPAGETFDTRLSTELRERLHKIWEAAVGIGQYEDEEQRTT
ncbi:hypothetical protein PUNSTDRAFT_43949 [Punctularia strigosozonata HHB-11173 SS5]|uniref:uncharacterized protein n=1 Tax=Punctularia strigosozonata (strain HHB-11173) TaxID=741275 RepID=UPI0004416A15|nr:uncharacterized protein PUNSTDRAFT_43949 [Punctularia strigosozonata HHB-11173 SS5]EIN09620.1 hypothetical protein PUNSTDRAFT_43949 [Punctularia strigosozonata HHB-11173 SS5]